MFRTIKYSILALAITAALPGVTSAQEDYKVCGYHKVSMNYYRWFPIANNNTWFQSAGGDWNSLMQKPPDSWWLVGQVDGTNHLPVANNGRNNVGTPSDAVMVAGGYGTWASHGNANGLNFFWFKGGNCTELKENDSFANPAIQNNELQFRKTIAHEVGHALSLGHEDRYFALLYSGTWRQPPKYGSNRYLRNDDLAGVRWMVNWVNGNWPNTWTLKRWADMSAYNQSHDDWGNPGNLVMTDLSAYTVARNECLYIRHLQVENRGLLPAKDVNLKIVLSTDTTITAGDRVIWNGGWSGDFNGGRVWANGTLALTIPSNTPAGSYFVGWILTTATGELEKGNNTDIMRRNANGAFAYRKLTVTAQRAIRFTRDFVSGENSPSQCTSWKAFQASLTPRDYTKVTISGSADHYGTSCTNAATAKAIAAAMKAGTAGSWSCGRDWRTGTCGDGLELSAAGSICGCPNPNHIVRPCIGNASWGGIKTATCGGPSQSMCVEFIYNEAKTGACCLEDGSCVEDQTQEQCTARQGTAWHVDKVCREVQCKQPPATGACCLDGDCKENLTREECAERKGEWHQGEQCEKACPKGGCNGNEIIAKAKCKIKRGAVKKLIVLVKNGTPGASYTATLDSGQVLTKNAKGNGKAKFAFKAGNKPPCGDNIVTITTAGERCVVKKFGCNC